jgi:ribonuclease HI
MLKQDEIPPQQRIRFADLPDERETSDDMPRVEIWADGACDPNPGRGGWGCVLIYGQHRRELSGREDVSTNNRMELMAAIAGLEALKKPCAVRLCSDSQWLVKCATREWKRNMNLDLWERYDWAAMPHAIDCEWVRGHSGVAWNERCHTLATLALRGAA